MAPTERSVLKQANTVREALDTFLEIQKKGTPRVIHCCLVEVINFAVRSSLFILSSLINHIDLLVCSRFSSRIYRQPRVPGGSY